MGHVPYVATATYSRATVKIRLYNFKKKKKKKKGSSHVWFPISNNPNIFNYTVKVCLFLLFDSFAHWLLSFINNTSVFVTL
jgi:hypothetical protein